MKGTRLGPYELSDKIGEGGMGAVYLASDTRLGRDVAVKILPEEFATDADRLARFEREARAAAALSHPHIAAVFDVGVEGSTHFIVQEYLRGQSLRERLDAGTPSLAQALKLAAEVAEGVAAAHAAGVTHRDLKPENVFVTTDGHAKILDFGLAKLTEKVIRGDGSATQSPTIVATSTGQIMGTAGYMAPEQITGEEVDHRADLFAFGCLLYELVTGRKTFGGKNLPEVLHRLANEDPEPVTSVSAALPLELQRIVSKCLAKDPARRYQGAADLVVDLRQLRDDVEAGRTTAATAPGATGAKSAGNPRLFGAAAAAGAVLGAVALWLAVGTTAPASTPTTYLPLRDVAGLDNENRAQSAISPDGRYVAFATGRGPVEVWELDGAGGVRAIDESDGGLTPFFSPDSQWLGFLGTGNRLYRVPVGGGRPQTFSETIGPQVSHVTWPSSDQILVHTTFEQPALRIPVATGVPEEYFGLDRDAGEFGLGSVDPLPDGQRVVYSFWDDRWRIAVRDLASGERTVLTQGYGARYVSTGHLVWVRAQQLMGATFDPATLVLGEPVQLVTALGAQPGWGRPSFDFDRRGNLLYLEEPADRGTAVIRIDDDGDQTVIMPAERNVNGLAISPDEGRLALSFLTLDGDSQIWTYDMLRDDLVPVGQGDGWDQYPFFMEGGEVIAYISERDKSGDLYMRAADGTGPERRWISDGLYKDRPDESVDGDVVAEIVDPETRSQDIWVYPADSPDQPLVLVDHPAGDSNPSFSPDGRFVAFDSDRTGRSEIYVVAYPGGVGALEWKVTTGGGWASRWTADGRYLFYHWGDRIWRTRVESVAPLRTGTPEEFSAHPVHWAAWDVGPDGSYVIAAELLTPPKPRLILNWFAELERRLPRR